ncbi:MAG: hypothetical protein P8Y23_02665 [Candidatus Lokiarchaeota archaeon]
MKKTLFESRLDNTIDAGLIGIGETVDVKNKMGVHVAVGEVVAVTPMGLSIRENGFFDRDLYLFSVLEPEQLEVVGYSLLSSPDDRVAKRLAELGEEVPINEADKMDNYINKDNGNKDDEDDEDDEKDNNKEKDKEKRKKSNDDMEPLAKPESSVDVDSLPEDIKKSIISIVQMNEDQLNGVLSEIGDATVKALKRVNIKEPEIYSVVGKIQDSTEKILTSPIKRSIGKK